MSVRQPSSTAVLVCLARAVADGRYAVGRFADPIARQLLDPGDVALVDAVRAGDAAPPAASDRARYEMVRRGGVMMVPRTVAIDEAIREHGAGQLVLLGAGLDARAWRMPELAEVVVFEVDHPASQHDKLRRLGALVPTARRVLPVEVDLANERLRPPLVRAGFDRHTETTWVWEGVVPYLTAYEVRSTIERVSEISTPGSRLVINYQAKSVATTAMRFAMHLVLRVARQTNPLAAEPWRSQWSPNDMRTMLGDYGFVVISDANLVALSAGMALPPGSNRSLRNGRVAVAVRR
ncbi:MAG: S-adenosyl-L-methionine-dependent methyltransferase [Marmoricola sp.]|nr:S-adenosyl-L-methionine-dependent methyltransferase [Marmoricola sp.]